MSLDEVPQTALSVALVPLVISLQLVPSKCRITPPFPTAYISLDEAPQTPFNEALVPLIISLQLDPS
jgi:hypothetical protein